MVAMVRTFECFPTPIALLGFPHPAPEPDHAACSGGYTQEGLIGGWRCPCECHQRTVPNGSRGAGT